MLRYLVTTGRSSLLQTQRNRPLSTIATSRISLLGQSRNLLFKTQQHNIQQTRSNASSATAVAVTSAEEMNAAAALCCLAADGDLNGLKEAVKKYDINSRDYDHRTALHLAAANGHAQTVEFLLENGAASMFDRFGMLPVHEAKRYDHFQAEKLFPRQNTLMTIPPEFFTAVPAAKELSDKLRHQMDLVFQLIVRDETFAYSLVASEVVRYYADLGLDTYYFDLFTPPQVAKHISAFITSKHAVLHGDVEQDQIHINIHDENSLFTACSDSNRAAAEEAVENFAASSDSGFHVTYFKSRKPIVDGKSERLSIFHVMRDRYENKDALDSDDVYVTATPYFLRTKKDRTVHRYQDMMSQTMDLPYPIVQSHTPTHTFTHDIKISHRAGRDNATTFLRQLSRTFDYLGVEFHKLHIDTFSNGINVYSIYCNAEDADMKMIENYSTLALTIPDVPMYDNFLEGKISQRQLMYLFSATRFA